MNVLWFFDNISVILLWSIFTEILMDIFFNNGSIVNTVVLSRIRRWCVGSNFFQQFMTQLLGCEYCLSFWLAFGVVHVNTSFSLTSILATFLVWRLATYLRVMYFWFLTGTYASRHMMQLRG